MALAGIVKAESDITDLGVLSWKTSLRFPAPEGFHPSHDWMELRIFPLANQTNITTVVLTNELLTLHHLPTVLHGPAVIEAKCMSRDGEVGRMRFYKALVRRRPLAGPEAVPVPLHSDEESKATSLAELRFIRQRARDMASPVPAPAGALPIITVVPPPPPLPSATNLSYNAFMKREQAAALTGQRRSQ